MSTLLTPAPQSDSVSFDVLRIAPRPQTIAATGLSASFLSDLVEKHLFEGGVLSMRELVIRTALSGRLLEEFSAFCARKVVSKSARSKPTTRACAMPSPNAVEVARWPL